MVSAGAESLSKYGKLKQCLSVHISSPGKNLTMSVRFTWATVKLTLSHGDNGMALSATASVRPYGRWLAVSVELLLWDYPRLRWERREPWHVYAFSFFASLFLHLSVSLSLCPFVAPSTYQSIWSPMLRDILTDPLEELRDSISRQQNSTVVLGNLAALERWALKEE